MKTIAQRHANLVDNTLGYYFRGHIQKAYDILLQQYNQGQRYHHTVEHLNTLLDGAVLVAENNELLKLVLLILFHDAVYLPGDGENEIKSYRLLQALCPDGDVKEVFQAILESDWKKPPTTELGKKLFALDCALLAPGVPAKDRLTYEINIFRENQLRGWEAYQYGRNKFFDSWQKTFPEHKEGVEEQRQILQAWQPKIAVYPGSFNPFHFGHLSVLREAERIFDQVVVLVGVNPDKDKNPGERAERVQGSLTFHEVKAFSGLLSEELAANYPTATIIRGLRNGFDLEEEMAWRTFMHDFAPENPVVWIGTKPELQHISSKAIRGIQAHSYEKSKKYFPDQHQIYGL